MGYLLLAAALAAGVIKGYCGKRTGNAIACNSDSMIMNVLRMLLCTVIGFWERINLKCIVGISLSLIALIMLNIL